MNTKPKAALLTVSSLLIILVVALLNSQFVPKVEAASTTIYVSIDAETSESAPDTNQGTNDYMDIMTGTYDHYGWMKFDLSSIPSGSEVTEAILWAYNWWGAANGEMHVHFASDDTWTETGITWNNQPTVGALLDSTTITSDAAWFSWDVTSQVDTEQKGDDIITLVFKVTNSSVWQDMATRESAYDEYLSITYSNPAPVNDGLSLTNPSIGTQGVIPDYQAYIFRALVSDGSGGTDINYVDLTLDYGGQNLRFRWTESTDTFTEEYDPNGYVSISSTSADSTLSGNQWTLDFKITFAWSYPDQNLHTVRLYSVDDASGSDTDDYANVYYVELDVPVNDQLTLVNPSIGSQGVLANKQSYTFRAKVTDNKGGSYIDYVDLTLDYGGEDLRFRWTESTDTFSEEYDPFGYVSISSTSSDSTLSGNQWTLDFKITFDWDYPDESLHTVRLYSVDDFGSSDTDDYVDLYYVENDLEANSLAIDDTRVNPSQSGITFSGYWYYQGTTIAPPDGNYHVVVKLNGVQKGTEDATLVSGYFSINDVQAESSVGLYQYTCEADYMAWAGNFPDLIVDKVSVTITASNVKPAINETVTFTVSGKYAYDNTDVSTLSFEVTRNGTFYASSTPFTDKQSTMILYSYTTSNANDTGYYGITSFTTNTVNVGWGYSYALHGAYNEEGERWGAINVTFFREGQAPESIELDGTYTFQAANYLGSVFRFELGYNESRVFYLMYPSEDIYVFKPYSPYYTYYFTVVDYIGITNGYLETVINMNGTDTVVERWKLDILNDIPFTLSWGRAYKIRLISDQGTYVFGTYVAGAKSTFVLPITHATFPANATSVEGIWINTLRKNGTWIQVNYTDSLTQTNWVQVQILLLPSDQLAYSTNNTGNSQQINWYSAVSKADYKVIVTVDNPQFGTKSWIFFLPSPLEAENPWHLDWLGTFIIPLNQVFGIAIVCFVFAAFSVESAPLAGIVGVLVAAILTVIGFLNLNAAWLAVTMGLAILVALSIQRKRSEGRGV